MIIRKQLKRQSFEYDFDHRMLALKSGILTKTEMFSLMRFIIRVAQKGKTRKRRW